MAAHRRGLVLTYVALPDPRPHEATATIEPTRLAVVGRPLSPSPASLDFTAVATHACRHLALLLDTDPVAARAAHEEPELWMLLADLSAAPAGALSADCQQ
ncbi:MAG: hypothetical protein GEV03_11930 [Streptosporangiales bacterium]|nr:hypothetical protein [Streptosporangiales bacterium]